MTTAELQSALTRLGWVVRLATAAYRHTTGHTVYAMDDGGWLTDWTRPNATAEGAFVWGVRGEVILPPPGFAPTSPDGVWTATQPDGVTLARLPSGWVITRRHTALPTLRDAVEQAMQDVQVECEWLTEQAREPKIVAGIRDRHAAILNGLRRLLDLLEPTP